MSQNHPTKGEKLGIDLLNPCSVGLVATSMMLVAQRLQPAPRAPKHTAVLENSFRQREGESLRHVWTLWQMTPGVGQAGGAGAWAGCATSS